MKRKAGGLKVSLTPEELLRVLRIAKKHSLRDWCMVLLSYRHGLRSSEVCCLKLDDIDLKSESLTVQRLKGSLRTQQPLYPYKGEPLLDELKALRAYLAERKEDGSRCLFLSQKGGALARNSWFLNFQTISHEAGLPPSKQRPHVLKHSLATHLIAADTNLALVKQALGHKSISSTLEYIGTTDAQAAKAVAEAARKTF